MKKRNERGFTLIELLAVITIMGVLMIIAVPSVTAIINNSRKKVYVQDALVYVNEARNLVAENQYPIDDPNTTYYVHINNLTDEPDTAQSPWAKWKDSYVAITFETGGDFEFYWVSADKAGWRINLEKETGLTKGDVYHSDSNKEVNFRNPIGGRRYIVLIDKNGSLLKFEPLLELTTEEAKKCFSFSPGSDGEMMLTYYKKECGPDVVIPSFVDGKKVTTIYQYTFNNMGLKSVYIPETVKEIGSRAFAYNQLTSVYIPSSVTKVGNEAFLSNKLTDLSIEEGVTTLGSGSFRNNRLTQAVVPSSVTSLGACSYCDNPIPNPTFLYKQKADGSDDYTTVRGYIGDLTEFPDKVFRIPAVTDGVALTTIASSAFASMSLGGWQVVIPDTVTSIGDSAFNASGVGAVNMPSNLKTIGSSAFYNNRIEVLNIPDSVTSIGTLAFNRNYVTSGDLWIYKRTSSGIDYSTIIGYSGRNRNNVVIPGTAPNGTVLRTLYDSALRYLNLTGTIIIPDSVTTIGSLCFALNELSDVNNGTGDNEYAPFVYARKSGGGFDKTNILSYAGYGTNNVIVPEGVVTLSAYSFYYTYIKGVTLPNSLKTIGSYSFQICKLNGTVVIPPNVTSIGTKAFEKAISWNGFNDGLTTIVNKTDIAFDWKNITGGSEPATFVEGVAPNWYGDIQIVKG